MMWKKTSICFVKLRNNTTSTEMFWNIVKKIFFTGIKLVNVKVKFPWGTSCYVRLKVTNIKLFLTRNIFEMSSVCKLWIWINLGSILLFWQVSREAFVSSKTLATDAKRLREIDHSPFTELSINIFYGIFLPWNMKSDICLILSSYSCTM